MKVPPKRKGNPRRDHGGKHTRAPLNESPSEKEGKSHPVRVGLVLLKLPSMKVPPKRKGNTL